MGEIHRFSPRCAPPGASTRNPFVLSWLANKLQNILTLTHAEAARTKSIFTLLRVLSASTHTFFPSFRGRFFPFIFLTVVCRNFPRTFAAQFSSKFSTGEYPFPIGFPESPPKIHKNPHFSTSEKDFPLFSRLFRVFFPHNTQGETSQKRGGRDDFPKAPSTELRAASHTGESRRSCLGRQQFPVVRRENARERVREREWLLSESARVFLTTHGSRFPVVVRARGRNSCFSLT